MSKENRWLIIFASIFLVIGIVSSLLIGQYMNYRRDEKLLRDYKEIYPTATKVEVKKLKNDLLTDSYQFKDDKNQNLGKIYIGGDVAIGLEYFAFGEDDDYDKEEEYIFTIAVAVDVKDEIKSVSVKESEHTPDFVEIVEQYFEKLKGEKLLKYKFVDEIAGASDYTMPVVRDVLTAVVKEHLDQEPEEKPEITLEPHEEIFGEDTTYEELTGFTGNEIVTKKAEVKDENGNLLGYAYTGVVNTDLIPNVESADLELLIGVNLEGKVEGVVTVLSEHTKGFYAMWDEAILSLTNINVEDLNVDGVTGATVSGNLINEILNGVKDFIANEEPVVELSNYEKLFGEGATETFVNEETLVKTIDLPEAATVDEEITVTKEEVYDEGNNLVGYAYSGKANTNLIPLKDSADLVLLIGINLEGKVVGVITVLSEHTPGFYATWVDSLANLSDVNLEDLNVDGISGATVSKGFINGIFEAIKEVITNE